MDEDSYVSLQSLYHFLMLQEVEKRLLVILGNDRQARDLVDIVLKYLAKQ